MALHTFESRITLPPRQFSGVVRYFESQGEIVPREYQSIIPTFKQGGLGRRIGEIAFTYAMKDEFAGTLFVGDGEKDQRHYDYLLWGGGLSELEIDEVSVLRFNNHLVAGKLADGSDKSFTTTSVVRDNLVGRGQLRAQRMFDELTTPLRADEFKIKPSDVYDIAKLLSPLK